MKEIPLTKGKVALVSDEDYEYLSQFKWQVIFNGRSYYACRRVEAGYENGKRKRKTILMHREVAERAGKDMSHQIDHEDRISLNNQRHNLRPATQKQNSENMSLKKNNASGHRGVYWAKRNKRWVAQIKHNNKQIYLGEFEDKEDAIKARLKGEKKYYTHAT